MGNALTDSLRRAARDWRAYVIVAFVALCASLPGITQMPVMDVDEARFVQASRQMLETGDFVRIRLQNAERNKKPAGTHWLQAASTALLEPIAGRQNAIWTYRIPSVLGALLAALATLWAGRVLLGPEAGLLGASLLSAGILFGFEGMTAKTDALMAGFTTLAIAALARLRAAHFGFATPLSHRRARGMALLFWAALGCGILIKGPVPLMVVLLTCAALALWDRRAAWMAPLGWLPGPLLSLLIVLPWAIAIGLATDWRFYTAAFTQDLAPKLAGEDHAHGGIFGFHTLLLPLLMFPATFALPAAGRLIAWKDKSPADASAIRFLLAWAGPTLLMFELSPGKLLHYAMPIYPAIALLCGAGLIAAIQHRWRGMQALGFVLYVAIGALLTVAIGFGLRSLSIDWQQTLAAAGLCGVIVLGGALTILLLRTAPARTAAAVVSGLLLCIALRGVVFPNTAPLQVSARSAAALSAAGADHARAIWIVGYDEPSLIFLTRTSAIRTDVEETGRRAQAGDAILADNSALPELERALAARWLTFTPRGDAIHGIAMSSSDEVNLVAGAVHAVNAAD